MTYHPWPGESEGDEGPLQGSIPRVRPWGWVLAVVAVLLLAAGFAIARAWGQPGLQYPTLAHALYAAGYTRVLYIDTNNIQRRLTSPFNPHAVLYQDRYGHPASAAKGNTVGERFSCARVNPWVQAGMVAGFNPPGWTCETDQLAQEDAKLLTQNGQQAWYDTLPPAPVEPEPSPTASVPVPTPTAPLCFCCPLVGECRPAGCRIGVHDRPPLCEPAPTPTPSPAVIQIPPAAATDANCRAVGCVTAPSPARPCRPGVRLPPVSDECWRAWKQITSRPAGQTVGPKRLNGLKECPLDKLPTGEPFYVPGVLTSGVNAECIQIGGQP